MAEEGEEIDTKNMSPEEIAELQKKNCIFCKIASKEIPAKVLHEDEDVICILDINPASEGHILILPKKHFMILPHIPGDLIGKLFKAAKLMSNTLLKTLQCKGTTVFIANGGAAGQKAPHVIIHVFPRKENDGLIELTEGKVPLADLNAFRNQLSPYLTKIFGKGRDLHLEKPAPKKQEKPEPKKEKVEEEPEESEEQDQDDSDRDDSDNDDSNNDADDSEEKAAPKKPKKAEKTKPEKSEKPASNSLSLDDVARLFG